MVILRDTRKTWVPLIKLAVASGADIWGDYVFYDRTDLDEDPNLDKYELPLYVFWIVSCVFGGLTMFTLLAKGCCPSKSGQNNEKGMSTLMSCFTLNCLVTRINQVLSMEIIFEDIPQFVLTSLISNERGLLTPAAVFNLTTSAFNFLFNILDMIGVNDEDDDNDENNDNNNRGSGSGSGSGGGGLVYNDAASRSSRNNNVVVEEEA